MVHNCYSIVESFDRKMIWVVFPPKIRLWCEKLILPKNKKAETSDKAKFLVSGIDIPALPCLALPCCSRTILRLRAVKALRQLFHNLYAHIIIHTCVAEGNWSRLDMKHINQARQ